LKEREIIPLHGQEVELDNKEKNKIEIENKNFNNNKGEEKEMDVDELLKKERDSFAADEELLKKYQLKLVFVISISLLIFMFICRLTCF
jgi:uncharacterized membrane protein (DUF106 family)